VKYRHRLAQAQRRKPAPRNRSEAREAPDEPSQPSRAKKRAAHQMEAEGSRARQRLDKFRRGARPLKRFDGGGAAGSSAGSTRTADDPGGEISAANKGRKTTLDWIRDELTGGTKPAYARGGGQRSKRYDAGGAAPPGGSNLSGGGAPPDFVHLPQVDPVTAFVRQHLPPLENLLRNPPNYSVRNFAQPQIQLKKRGGQVHKNPKSRP
jgi:hypothetical protein